MLSIHDHTGRFLRPLGADLVFRLPVVGELARKGGATLACNEDAERMLRGGELVGVWPEGFKGIGKPFSERYKLQRFGRGGFVSAAIRTGVPIIPTSVVGAEEIYPLVGNVPSLARLLGVPYMPITPLFPLLGPLGLVPLPSKWLIEFGEPIRTDAYDAGAADDPMLVFNVTDQVRETIQQTLYSLLMQAPLRLRLTRPAGGEAHARGLDRHGERRAYGLSRSLVAPSRVPTAWSAASVTPEHDPVDRGAGLRGRLDGAGDRLGQALDGGRAGRGEVGDDVAAGGDRAGDLAGVGGAGRGRGAAAGVRLGDAAGGVLRRAGRGAQLPAGRRGPGASPRCRRRPA